MTASRDTGQAAVMTQVPPPASLPFTTIARDWLASEGPAWIFIFKTCLAAVLALWVAFRLGFDQPSTAMTTVFIVAQPQTGLILAKSFYRIIGTLIGLVVTIAMVAAFAQYRELFLIAITLWVGLCVAGASWFRDFQAYAFLLAGYTSCLIGFPGVIHPDSVFQIAVTRVSEILLGILCVTVISDAILPQRLSPRLVLTVRGQFSHFIRFLHDAVAMPLDRSVTVTDELQFVSDVLTLESLRAATLFEDPASRIRSDRLRLFNADFMTVSTTLHALQQLARRMRSQGWLAALRLLRPCVDGLGPVLLQDGRPPAMAAEAGQLVARLETWIPLLQQQLQVARMTLEGEATAEECFDFDCAAELLEQFVAELHRFASTYASLALARGRSDRRAPGMVWHVEPGKALASGLRATAAMLTLTLFWILSAWPEGAAAATIACIGCALFAASPAPLRAVRQMGTGFAAGTVAAYVCGFHVLNQMDGFAQLALGMLPFMMAGTWLMTRPRTAGVGAGFNLMFTNALLPQNVMSFDAVSFLNNGIAQLVGLVVAGIAFSVLTRQDARAVVSGIAIRLRQELGRACTDALRHLPHAFDGRTRDLMRRLLGLPVADRDRLLSCALSVLELGDAIVDLRQTAAGELAPSLQAGVGRLLAALKPCFASPGVITRAAGLAALQQLLAAVDASRAQPLSRAQQAATERLRRCLHRIHAVMNDDDWFTAFSDPGIAALATGDTGHAA